MSNKDKAKELVKKSKVATIYDFMDQKRDLIASALPKAITPDRLIGVFTMVLKTTPALAECTQTSLVSAIIQTVQYGLTPGNIGHCHYVPFKNKQANGTYQKEVQFILGYKGIVELVNRCGKAVILSTEVVYENDEFDYALGLNPVLKHLPTHGERGNIQGVYCVAKNLVANEKVFIYLNKGDIDKVRKASKAGQTSFSPWSNWYEEMAKKTAIKRICKLLPISVDIQEQLSSDETIKTTIDKDMATVPDRTVWEGETVDAEAKTETPEETPGEAVEEPPEAKPEPPEGNSNPITEKQVKRFFAIASKSGKNNDEIHEWLLFNYEIKSANDIQKEQYEEICEAAELIKPQEQS